MTDKRVKVPEGSVERANKLIGNAPAGDEYANGYVDGMIFMCNDIAEHPIVPTDEQAEALFYEMNERPKTMAPDDTRDAIVEFQRRFMFTEPEPEPDAELRSFLSVEIGVNWQDPHCAHMVEIATKAFRRGQQSMIRKGE